MWRSRGSAQPLCLLCCTGAPTSTRVSALRRRRGRPDLVKFPSGFELPQAFPHKINITRLKQALVLEWVPALPCMSQLSRPDLQRLIATANKKKERIWQDRCVNYHSDGGNDAVPAPSVFSPYTEKREGWRWDREEGVRRKRWQQRAEDLLSYWAAADWSLRHHLGVFVSLVTAVSAQFLSGDGSRCPYGRSPPPVWGSWLSSENLAL